MEDFLVNVAVGALTVIIFGPIIWWLGRRKRSPWVQLDPRDDDPHTRSGRQQTEETGRAPPMIAGQRVVLVLTAVALVGLLVFPPYEFQNSRGVSIKSAGHAFSVPTLSNGRAATVNVKLLALEQLAILIAGLLVWVSLHGFSGVDIPQPRYDEDARGRQFAVLSKEEQERAKLNAEVQARRRREEQGDAETAEALARPRPAPRSDRVPSGDPPDESRDPPYVRRLKSGGRFGQPTHRS